MPVDGLDSGIQHKVSWIDSTGILRFQLIESFQSKEDATTNKHVQMNGEVRHPKFHMGWSGSFVLERSGDFMDSYIAAQEADYLRGIDQRPVTITETITEVDGTVSQWQYTNAVLTLENAGDWTGIEITKQNVTFQARRKIKI